MSGINKHAGERFEGWDTTPSQEEVTSQIKFNTWNPDEEKYQRLKRAIP